MKSTAVIVSLIVVVLLISARWSSKAVNPPQIDSTLARGLSLNGLTDRSDLIAIGTCVDTKSVWADRTLVTLTTIAVAETLKGAEQSTITVALPGGIDANRKFPVAMTYSGAPQIFQGEDVFLFLRADDRNVGGYTVTGFSQGKFSIVKDENGEQFVNHGGRDHRLSLRSLKDQVKAHLRQR